VKGHPRQITLWLRSPPDNQGHPREEALRGLVPGRDMDERKGSAYCCCSRRFLGATKPAKIQPGFCSLTFSLGLGAWTTLLVSFLDDTAGIVSDQRGATIFQSRLSSHIFMDSDRQIFRRRILYSYPCSSSCLFQSSLRDGGEDEVDETKRSSPSNSEPIPRPRFGKKGQMQKNGADHFVIG
jgi:hypothetical protein